MVYLDHAASTPMLPEAVAAMSELLGQVGNASSLHATGRRARRIVEESRERLAQAVGARPSEVIFTGGGTEADNLAVNGLFWSRRAADTRRRRVVVSAVEHHAVLDSAEWLWAHEGAEVSWLPVDPVGRAQPDTLAAELDRYGDEVALAEVAHAHGVPLHTDAVQAVGALPVDFAASGVDALTMTGHKLGGPLGAGALLLSRTVELTPLLHGGDRHRPRGHRPAGARGPARQPA